MNEQQLPHFWIPDEEVEQLDKKPMKIAEDRGLDHSEHGTSLSNGLRSIMSAYADLESNSLSDEDIVIFKMILPAGEDIYGQKDFVAREGMKINAVKDKHKAIVSTTKSMFSRLQDRVGRYRDSGSLKDFQEIDTFEPFTAEDKEAASLRQYLEEEKDKLSVDVQLMFTPNLDEKMQDRAAERLTARINNIDGQMRAKRYHLSDGTAVIRADVPIKALRSITDDPAIYRVEQTGFFSLVRVLFQRSVLLISNWTQQLSRKIYQLWWCWIQEFSSPMILVIWCLFTGKLPVFQAKGHRMGLKWQVRSCLPILDYSSTKHI